MRKLYAYLAGVFLILASSTIRAQNIIPDVANFTTTINTGTMVSFTNTSVIGNVTGERRAWWDFGDNTRLQTPALGNAQHAYNAGGTYTVCLKIYRYFNNDSVLTASECKTVIIPQTATCTADYSYQSTVGAGSPVVHTVSFTAIPSNSQNRPVVAVCWNFGDGSPQVCVQAGATGTNLLQTTHTYTGPGPFTACVRIYYQEGCVAEKCRVLELPNPPPTTCQADFERIQSSNASPLSAYFRAILSNSANRPPQKICWNFGDGHDTCITYPENYTGQYVVNHNYAQPGNYNVCVTITYYGGCIATKCRIVEIVLPVTCQADFQRVQTTANSLQAYFQALTSNSANRKPQRICWNFGDGHDTCINYTEAYTGPYAVGHAYSQPGNYNVCVTITYFGGCVATKCRIVEIVLPVTCAADFERIQSSTANPLSAYFRALPSNSGNRTPQKICWNFGDGHDTCINYPETYTGQYVVNHNYTQSGNYNVCVKITYYGGCEATKCRIVEIVLPVTCQADFERLPAVAGTNPLTAGFKAIPNNSGGRKPQKVCWNFGDGHDTCITYSETYTGIYTVNHTYANAGNYNVCVKITYYGGCEATRCRVIEIVLPVTCGADFQRLMSTNNPLQVYLQAIPSNSANRKPQKVCWNFGDGRDTCITYPETFSGVYAVSHTYAQAGNYNVCVKITYYGGCESTRCRVIEIVVPVTCQADFERLPAISANSLVTTFKAIPNNSAGRKPQKVCWQFGDGHDTCITYPETYTGIYTVNHTYAQPGTYNVCVTITYFGGCQASRCRTIVIPPPVVTCSVGLLITSQSAASPVRTLTATPNSSPTRIPTRICWHFGDGTDSCITLSPNGGTLPLTINHTYPGPGVYHPCVQIRYDGGCEATACGETSVVSTGGTCGGYLTDSLVSGRTFKFKGFSIHGPNETVLWYKWTFGDGTTDQGQEVTHTYNAPGEYRVCLSIKLSSGCETNICKTVRVLGPTQQILVITPNPVLNELHAQFISALTETVNIKILNNFGNVVMTSTRNATVGVNNWTFMVGTLTPGIYSFTVQSSTQMASTTFIKL